MPYNNALCVYILFKVEKYFIFTGKRMKLGRRTSCSKENIL